MDRPDIYVTLRSVPRHVLPYFRVDLKHRRRINCIICDRRGQASCCGEQKAEVAGGGCHGTLNARYADRASRLSSRR
eukprot:2020607-Pyramimonas_sp.AAC.1